MARQLLSTAGVPSDESGSGTITAATVTGINSVSSTVNYFDAPANGMAQFKGLTTSTTEATYVQVICLGIVPHYATWATLLSTTGGFVINCYTGIPQCQASLVDGYTPLNSSLTATTASTCMADPRYLTWRSYVVKTDFAGVVGWFRLDSYWNSAAKQAASTWGPAIHLSTSIISDLDNAGTTTAIKGLTFVFAYADGSGIQFNHINTGWSAHSSNTSAGSGTNSLTTAPSSYTNNLPGVSADFAENLCLSSDLLLSGTTDTSSLDSTITAYSDGYKAKISLALEMILPGAGAGWAGVCIVYYSTEYVQNNTNGSVCFAAGVNSATGSGPRDFGAGYLMEVTSSTWKPPAASASLTPSSGELSGTKYGITKSPSAAVATMFTQGYYASVEWYQPKYASTYTGIARYGKDDYAGAYCMQGAGSTSYFSATAGSAKLTGAVSLATSILALGTAISLAM